MTKQRVTNRWVSVFLAVLAGILNVALTGIAFWLSYEHLHDVAAANGLERSGARAWAWPATLDTFIVIGEILMLRASLAGRWDWWAASFMAVGSAGSITLNVVGVGEGAGVLDYTVAAVPPVAALLSFGMLMRQLHAAIKDYLDGTPAARPRAKETPRPRRRWKKASPPVSEPVSVPPVPVSQPDVPAPQRPSQAPSRVSLKKGGTKKPRVSQALVPPAPDETVKNLTTIQAAGLAGVPASTIRTWKQRGKGGRKLVPVVDGPDVLYSREDVLAFVKGPKS